VAEGESPKHGVIGWVDLTIPEAGRVRDFYSKVVGWTVASVDMGGYEDYCMNHPETGTTVAGICHARGTNLGIPPQWLVYITVPDMAKAMAAVKANGGEILREPTGGGGAGSMCVIRDPAGAVAALFQPA